MKSATPLPPVVHASTARPRTPSLWLSIFAHLAALSLLIVLRHSTTTHITPAKYQSIQRIAASTHLAFNSKYAQPDIRPTRPDRHLRQARKVQPASGTEGSISQGLLQEAQQATAAITMSLRFRHIYGFTLGPQYQLAVQTSGEIPPISTEEVPLHFQQYVIIEVTIDVDGGVAQARVVAGVVDSRIEQKLLSAIREFKYNPATRDGIPIPSQRDIVIHIPT